MPSSDGENAGPSPPTVPGYEVLEELGRGGMGIVYRARHKILDRIDAIKVLQSHLAADPEYIARFLREARAAAKLVHPNIVQIYGADQVGLMYFLAMEFVDGPSLDRVLRHEGRLTAAMAARALAPIARALGFAHSAGIIHRDVKPANILVTSHGVPKLSDLGLAKTMTGQGEAATPVTTAGYVLGTVSYMPPEQASGGTVDGRSDIYALGCTLYHLLTGTPPFGGRTPYEVLRQHEVAPPPIDALDGDLVPAAMRDLLVRMLAKSPADRPQTADEVARTLAELAQEPLAPSGRPPVAARREANAETGGHTGPPRPEVRAPAEPRARSRRRVVLVAAGVALVAAAVLAVFVFGRGRPVQHRPEERTSASSPVPDTGAARSGTPSAMRNAKLRDLPDNTWLQVGPFKGRDKGSSAMTWCYDRDMRRFVRVGGFTLQTYSNEVVSYDLGAETWTFNLPYARDATDPTRCPSDRPGYGCDGGICYDQNHRCIWHFTGSSGDYSAGNIAGLWKGEGDLRVRQWTHIDGVPHLDAPRVGFDGSTQKVVCIGRSMANYGQTVVYDPATGRVTQAYADPGGGKAGSSVGNGSGFVYVPELKGCLLVARTPTKFEVEDGREMTTWLFDSTAGTWKDLAPVGLGPSARIRHGIAYDTKNRVAVVYGGTASQPEDLWVYDPLKNTWGEMKPEFTPGQFYKTSPMTPDACEMMAYDEEHNVHVVVLRDAVWAYRYKK